MSATQATRPSVVVMGVSGSGKSTVGLLLAERLGVDFLDADDLHSDQARAKMASGLPLDDADRAPWLERVADRIKEAEQQGSWLVVACSALRRTYRDALRRGAKEIVFIHLHGAPDLLRTRMSAREGHFMPPALLDSQLSTLEMLTDDEVSVVVDIGESPAKIVDHVAQHLAKS